MTNRIDSSRTPVRLSASTSAPVVQKKENTPVATKDELRLSSAPPKTDGLVEDEIRLLKGGLLPNNYSDLKATMQKDGLEAAKQMFRQGKQGPFSDSYGDPEAMLASAKRAEQNPELLKLFKDTKRGDILLTTWNSDNIISNLTKGPFIHAMLCTEAGPPPEFIEAIGMTAGANENNSDTVRRCTLGESLYDRVSMRILRPTEGLPDSMRNKAIDQAIRYAEKQLGRPYDYAFTNENKGNGLSNAFYCSELAYLAYASPEGADFELPLKKSTDRDKLLVAIESAVDSLQPKDKPALMAKAMKFVAVQDPPPTAQDLVDFVVDQVMPDCKTTEPLVKNAESREKLKSTIHEIMDGKAFDQLEKAIADYQQQEQDGKFKGILGTFKEWKAKGAIPKALLADCKDLLDQSGLKYQDAVKTVSAVLSSVLPFTASVSGEIFGKNDQKTKTINSVFNEMEWLKNTFPLPILKDLPSRAKAQVKEDFVSPTDLAWVDLPHYDYNEKQENPLDPQ